MTVLGIIGCRIFEDEIVHVFENDPEINRIYLVENEENRGLLKKLEGAGFKPEVMSYREIRAELKKSSEFSVIVQLQGMGLHIDPARLKKETYVNVNLISRLADGVLLFYGLCGLSFSKMQKDFEYIGCPVKLLQERSESSPVSPLDDCVAAALGGNTRYRKILKSHRDTFFFTPMWAANWKAVFGEGEKLLQDFEFTPAHLRELGYRKVARVRTGLSYEPDFEKNVEEFARRFGLEITELEGGTKIARESYSQLRNMLIGPLQA
ncbi:DUF1638 domain-containing protein [Methanosarcina sp. KYL-1]|uniref:DUF1638 domain-containing protein n=1 Tax=Methanosarcina sp. KYL-1 TaxID=2602068 RepID=UPI002100EE91|nr:DUF1638 domain-containing protein [Methanosarcina sp. KYL-1]MCQ1535269.1 DUF1638 domain-containing protein [Methanosarcina sp. KYL-1]